MDSANNQMQNTFPAECDIAIYRELYADLKVLSDADLFLHFLNHGIPEGRITNSIRSRIEFIALIPTELLTLEIGPFYDPIVRGENVKYFDVLSHEELLQRAQKIGRSIDKVPYIDFVDPFGDLSTIKQQFDVIVSSHNIEHQPDLINHFNKIEQLLTPGGLYFCIIPDKRYCFDHFIPETTIADIITRNIEQVKTHYLKNVIAHRVLTTHNSATDHWDGNHGDPHNSNIEQLIPESIAEYNNAAGAYIDVHASFFTPQNFSRILSVLNKMNLTQLEVVRNYHTRRNQLEFYVIMQKTQSE